MKIGFGLYNHMLTDDYYALARQMGATHIAADLTDYFYKSDTGSSNQPLGNRTKGWGGVVDLSVGWNSNQIKIGSITQSERLAKYNRLLELENREKITIDEMERLKKVYWVRLRCIRVCIFVFSVGHFATACNNAKTIANYTTFGFVSGWSIQNDSKAKFIQKLEKGEHVKIGALGTSLTGGRWRWFTVMQEWLDKEFSEQLTYQNEGVGASASSHPKGRSGLDKAKILARSKPNVVFIEFAVNDAYQDFGISVEKSRQNLETIIEILKKGNPEVEIILQTMNVIIDMPELNQYESSKRPKLLKYVKMYRRVARKYRFLLIDYYRNWKKYLRKNGRNHYIKLVTDGVHPNFREYRRVLLPELKRALR